MGAESIKRKNIIKTNLFYKDDSLSLIQGKKFTPREIDIMACLVSGRAITIPSFLSISARTLETHIHNIMLKIGCNSRERIIDFIEGSGKLSTIRSHYQTLVEEILFEKSLKAIKSTLNKTFACVIFLKEHNSTEFNNNALQRLTDYFTFLGIKSSIKIKREFEIIVNETLINNDVKDQNSFFISLIRKEEYVHHHPTLIDADESYEKNIFVRLLKDQNEKECPELLSFTSIYECVFTLLQRFYPTQTFENIVDEFNAKRISLLNETKPLQKIEQTVENKIEKINERANHLLRYRGRYIVLLNMVILIFLCVGYTIFSSKNTPATKISIRPDLRIPVEATFLERPVLTHKIHQHFLQPKDNNPAIKVVGLVGIGGSGKTTIARAYAKTIRNISVMWEINAETHDTIVDSFKSLAYALAQTEESKGELSNIKRIQNVDELEKRIVIFVAKHLQRCPNWLLIYDNVESFLELEHFFPHDIDSYGAGKIIITTRDHSTSSAHYLNVDSIIHVEALNTSEILTLFKKMTYTKEINSFAPEKEKKLIHFLSYLPPYPLDVSIASYYIRNSDITYGTYLERMNDNTKSFINAQAAFLKDSNIYTKTRYNIITLSIKRLIDKDPEFKNLLMLLSLVAAEDIPKALFESYKDPVLIDRFMFSLKKYAFVTSKASSKHDDGDTTFSIHRSTQKIMREFLFESAEKDDIEKAIQVFTNVIQKFAETYVLKKTGETLSLVSHINEFMQNSDKVIVDASHKKHIRQDLCYALGYAYKRFSRNLLLEKECFVKAYESQAQTHHIPKHKLATMLNDLASICVDLSHNDDAILYAQKGLDLYQSLPDKTLMSVDCMRIIGLAYLLKNDFDNAKLHFNKGIALLSPLDVDARKEAEASIYAILGWLYSVTYINGERAEEGIAYGHKAVAILNAEQPLYTKIPPKEKSEKISCEIARAKASLADVYCHFGDYKKAYELGYRDVQYIIDNRLDSCSHHLLKTYMNIGMGEIYLREKRFIEARKTLANVIKEAESLMGSTNMLLLSPRVFSAETHIQLNELDAAYDDCLAAFKIEQKERTNYSKLILATAYYHAAIIKYKQGDYSKSFEHFSTFFSHIKVACKAIVSDKAYKTLEKQRVFDINKEDPNAVNSCFKQATVVFKAVYGYNHAFVKDYVGNMGSNWLGHNFL